METQGVHFSLQSPTPDSRGSRPASPPEGAREPMGFRSWIDASRASLVLAASRSAFVLAPSRLAGLLLAGHFTATSAPAHAAALDVSSTNPARWALGVSMQLGAIEITFDAPIVLPPTAAVRVAGTMSGLHAGTLTKQGNVLRWQRGAKAFLPGE